MENLEYNNRIKEKSDQLNSIIEILHEKYSTDDSIIEEIKKRKPKINLGTSYFSKYKNVNINERYLNQISEHTFNDILSALNLMLKEEFSRSWNSTNKKYEEIVFQNQEDNPHEKNDVSDEKLDTLIGTWKGYSWNNKRSKPGRGEINIFKVRIINKSNVICKTEKAEFNQGRMTLEHIDRLAIYLSNRVRKIHLFGKIGLMENLANVNRINLAYIDTGDEKVKCGIAVLIRTREKYNDIAVKSFPESDTLFEKNIVDFLRDTQHDAPMDDQ